MAEKFLGMVVIQYGLPKCITSNHDPQFCGLFWDDLMSLLNTALIFSMATHPQTDGMAEVTSHAIEQLLYIHV